MGGLWGAAATAAAAEAPTAATAAAAADKQAFIYSAKRRLRLQHSISWNTASSCCWMQYKETTCELCSVPAPSSSDKPNTKSHLEIEDLNDGA